MGIQIGVIHFAWYVVASYSKEVTSELGVHGKERIGGWLFQIEGTTKSPCVKEHSVFKDKGR